MYLSDSVPQIKILIVEDDILYKKVIMAYLNEDSCFKVIGETKDGQSAVNLANSLKPDVIIMDLGLPVMSGIQATKKIKEANPSIKFVILTSHVNQDEAVEALAAGASAYVNKDISINYMKMIIETVNKGAIWISPLIGQQILSAGIKSYKK